MSGAVTSGWLWLLGCCYPCWVGCCGWVGCICWPHGVTASCDLLLCTAHPSQQAYVQDLAHFLQARLPVVALTGCCCTWTIMDAVIATPLGCAEPLLAEKASSSPITPTTSAHTITDTPQQDHMLHLSTTNCLPACLQCPVSVHHAVL